MNIAEKYQRQASASVGESVYTSTKVENQADAINLPQTEVPTPVSPKKSHWGIWCIVAVLVVILMAVTCPSQDDHQEAVAKVVHEYVNSNFTDSDVAAAVVGSFFANGIIDVAIRKFVTADKYLIFSIGSLNGMDGSKERISFGIFGHVFTFNKEQLEERLSAGE